MLDALAKMDRIPGWLKAPAAAVSYHLIASHLRGQGPIAEIGVYRGKYLSVLWAASGDATRIVGYDTYPRDQQEVILRDLREAFGDVDNIHLVKADSTTLTPDRVIRECGGRPAFVSIDGSHEAGPVESDLRLATDVLADGGIVAADDFLNPFAIGVNEAFYRYQLASPPDDPLVPFAFVTNKLFLCQRTAAPDYLESVHSFVSENIDVPYLASTRERMEKGASLERHLLGWPILVIRL